MTAHINGLDPVEVRILGCLIEKQKTTPDSYPLTLNALRLACNQSTNRDPVVDYDENTIQERLQRMHRRELTRNASGHSSRASKYRHLLSETMRLGDAKQSVLAVLLLRGPQTPGELKTRTERMHPFADLDAVEQTLAALIEDGIAERLERRPGEKQVRYRHLLGDDDGESESAAEPAQAADGLDALARVTPPSSSQLAAEISALREEVESLRSELGELRARIDD